MILARGEVPSTEKKLRLAGANHVVLPATISASRMANLITNPSAVDFLTQIDQRAHLSDLLAQLYIQLTEVVVDTALAGYTIGDLAIRGKGAFIIVALRRADGEIIIHPGQSVYFKKDDILMLMGHQDDLPTLAQQAALRREMRYRGAQMR
jgi:voltage-gated potassium channel